MSYLIKRGCSTRRIPDPKCPDFINYFRGEIVDAFPAHVPIDEWVRDGVIEPVGEAPEQKARKGRSA